MEEKEEQAVTKDATGLLCGGKRKEKISEKKHIKTEGLKINPVPFFTNK